MASLLDTSVKGAFNAYNKYGFGRSFMGRIIKLGRQEFSDEILGKYSAYIQSFPDPGATRTILDTSYLGKKFVYPGVLEYNQLEAWTVKFKMTEGLGIKSAAEMELLRNGDPGSGRSLLPCSSNDDIIIAVLDETGTICRAKRLMGAWLVSVDDTEFTIDNTDIQELTMTWAYQIWEPYAISDAIRISDFNVSVGDAFPGDADDGRGDYSGIIKARYETFKNIVDEKARNREECKINF